MATCAILTCNKLAAQILTLGWRRSRFECVCECVTRGLGVWVKLCRGITTELCGFTTKKKDQILPTQDKTVCLSKVEERILNWLHEQIAAICGTTNKVLLHQGVDWPIYRNTVYKYRKLVRTELYWMMPISGERTATMSLWTSTLFFLTGRN